MSVWWSLLSGGPGGGKTTLVSHLSQGFRDAGARCVVVREAATVELIDGGVSVLSAVERQRAILRRSVVEQNLARALAARHALHGPTFVFQDRGPLDCKAYCCPAEFSKVAAAEEFNEASALDHVDVVFHVVTAPACVYAGPLDASCAGYNPARQEDHADAVRACERHGRDYGSHPAYVKVGNGPGAMRGKLVAVLSDMEARVPPTLRVMVSKAAAFALRAYDASTPAPRVGAIFTVLDRLVALQFEALTAPRTALSRVFGRGAAHLADKLRLYDGNMLTLWTMLDASNRVCLARYLGTTDGTLPTARDNSSDIFLSPAEQSCQSN